MYLHPFFQHSVAFHEHLEAAKERKLDERTRHLAFTLFAHEVIGWFIASASLQSITLTAVAHPEIESGPTAVRIRHHLKLTGLGDAVPNDDELLIGLVPWAMLGNGSFELRRDQAQLAEAIRLANSPTDDDTGISYVSLVHSLALRMDAGFDFFPVAHDYGLASSTR